MGCSELALYEYFRILCMTSSHSTAVDAKKPGSIKATAHPDKPPAVVFTATFRVTLESLEQPYQAAESGWLQLVGWHVYH